MRDLSQLDVESIGERVSFLHQQLSQFEQKLPSNLKFTDRNLYLQPSAAQRITFIMLKSWWHECHYDLYRFSLPGFRESINENPSNVAFFRYCQQQVIKSAVIQSRFWQLVASTKHILVSDPTVVVLVHSNTKVLLASRDLDPRDNPEDILEQIRHIPELLESNVSFLDELAKRLPRVAIIVSVMSPTIPARIVRPQTETFFGLCSNKRFVRLFRDRVINALQKRLLMTGSPLSDGILAKSYLKTLSRTKTAPNDKQSEERKSRMVIILPSPYLRTYYMNLRIFKYSHLSIQKEQLETYQAWD